MKNLVKLYMMLLVLSVFMGASNVIAQDVVGGVSTSGTGVAALEGSISFEPPILFNSTLPLETYMNSGTNALFVGGNGAVLEEGSSFGVTGHSPPNFLAYNPTTSNADGSVPALPAIIYFPTVVTDVKLNAGAGGGTTGNVILAALDAAFSVVATDIVAITPALQSLSVSYGAGIQAVVVVGQFTSNNRWMVLDDLRFN